MGVGSGPQLAVVGAGIAGLCAALELNALGCQVTVLERAAQPGGKLRQLHSATQPLDAGPTVLTLPGLFESILGSAGSSLEEHLVLRPLQLLARHAWSRAEQLDLYADIERTAAAIEAFAGAREARGYRRFCRDSRRIYQTLEPGFLHRPAPRLGALIATAGLRNLWQLRPFSTLWQALGDYFADPRLRQLFGRYATYCGSSPFRAPATLMLVAHVEQAGVWQVEGGMYGIARALAALLQARGVQLRYNAHVRRLHLERNRLHSLELENGERLCVSAAIATCDSAALAAGLLGAEVAEATARRPPEQRSLSAITWTGAVGTAGFELMRHNVFFSADYAAEFAALAAGRCLDAQPTIYVCAQDRQDTAAPLPEQPERILCLRNAPANGDLHCYGQEEIELCLMQSLSTLEHCGLSLLNPQAQLQATTPTDFNQLFPGSGGALYGPATHGWRASFQRPGARTRTPGLYLAGGSTHPGAGLPMAALSGRNAARCLLQDLGLMRR
jgi:1-hydroxycarotenoid 3,4-desaturase